MLRSNVLRVMRDFMANEGFLEIETPILCKSTPEGARDYLVPSRIHHGHFYALPQSPQLFKQLLMASGYDRYFQIARCFRDEDLRADRQPEFTQADMELSFVDIDDVIEVNERLLKHLFKEVINVDVEIPFKRMPWQEAMDRFGSDKPDTRFGMELCDVSDVVKDCGFGVFTGALENGGSVRGINVEGQAKMPRKKIDKLVEHAKGCGAKGLAYLCINEDGTYKSSFAKFMTEVELDALVAKMNGKPGDLLLFAADKNKIVWNVLGALRLMLGAELGLIDENKYNFLWVTEFPLLEWSDEENRFMAMHHPFTMPMEEDWDKIDSDPGAVRAKAYDIVLNGTELGGGSVESSGCSRSGVRLVLRLGDWLFRCGARLWQPYLRYPHPAGLVHGIHAEAPACGKHFRQKTHPAVLGALHAHKAAVCGGGVRHPVVGSTRDPSGKVVRQRIPLPVLGKIIGTRLLPRLQLTPEAERPVSIDLSCLSPWVCCLFSGISNRTF